MCAYYERVNVGAEEMARDYDQPVEGEIEDTPGVVVVRPTDTAPVVSSVDGGLVVRPHEWGLIPRGSATSGRRPINARIETVKELWSFRRAFEKRRALVMVSAFLEWQRVGRDRIRHRVVHPGGELYTLAALWECWDGPAGDVLTYTILTGPPCDEVAALHHRQPIVVPRDLRSTWLAEEELGEDVYRALSQPYEQLRIEGGLRQLSIF